MNTSTSVPLASKQNIKSSLPPARIIRDGSDTPMESSVKVPSRARRFWNYWWNANRDSIIGFLQFVFFLGGTFGVGFGYIFYLGWLAANMSPFIATSLAFAPLGLIAISLLLAPSVVEAWKASK